MPTYQYRCTECGNELEAVQKFTDSALTDCPDCTGQLRKVFNAVGVVFKGSGFYRTDSRADKKTGAGAGGSGAKTEGGSESAEKKSVDASSSSDKAASTSEKKSDKTSGKQPATAGTGGGSGSSSKGASSSSGSSTAA